MSNFNLKESRPPRDDGLWVIGGRSAVVCPVAPTMVPPAEVRAPLSLELHCRSEGTYTGALSPAGLSSGGYSSIHQTAASHVCPISSMPLHTSGESARMGSDALNQMERWDPSCFV
jgi:hypothetical protein